MYQFKMVLGWRWRCGDGGKIICRSVDFQSQFTYVADQVSEQFPQTINLRITNALSSVSQASKIGLMQLPATHDGLASLNDPAVTLVMRFDKTNKTEDVEGAIALHWEATRPTSIKQTHSSSLGMVLRKRFDQTYAGNISQELSKYTYFPSHCSSGILLKKVIVPST